MDRVVFDHRRASYNERLLQNQINELKKEIEELKLTLEQGE